VALPPRLAKPLRLAYARRSAGHWRSMWQHGRPATALVERRLRLQARAQQLSAVIQIGDLAIIDTPYFVLQDLSYDLLLDHFGERGVPHFRNLSRAQINRLRDRQMRVYDNATGLLPMSRWLAQRCIDSGYDASRIHVVNPGVNARLDESAPVLQRRQQPTKRLLFIGRDFETKGGDQLVAAFAILRRELGAGIALTIAGPKAWPLRGPVPDGVDYLGPVPTSQVQSLYDSHDLFVMPSRFEGFGIAFVEALVRGLPCVGRNACAMPEIITPGSGGRLVESEDPAELAQVIAETLADDDLYEECGKSVPQRRAYYTWDRASAEVISALGSHR
jgi:glycosyltransferase involved in cell wall biosynthesis